MKIAIFFPGIGYHCDKPLLYYARKIAVEFKYDKIITLSYSYDGKNIRGNKEKMKEAFDTLYEQTEKALEEIEFKQYSEILFISKSVGTIIASAYAVNHSLNCCHVLYTPLEQTFLFEHKKAIAFIGNADPWSDISNIQKSACSQKVPLKIYENVNHSLECENTFKNIEILEDVMKETYQFLV